MEKKKIFFIIIFAIFFLSASFVVFGIVKKRYFSPDKGEQDSGTVRSRNGADTSENGGAQSTESGQNPSDIQEGSEPGGQNNVHLYIASEDCDNNCAKFKGNGEDLRYCQEVCGDIPVAETKSKEECANLFGLEKDYCFKDLAVSKKDGRICDEVKDERVKKVCKNRIIEDILE